MDTLDKDALFSIAIELDLPSLLKLCVSNKNINNKICLKDAIWDYKLKEFPSYLNYDWNGKSKKEIYSILYNILVLKEKLGLKESIYEIYYLPEIDLNTKNIHEIPKEIKILKNLQILNVSNNFIKIVPKEIGNLINLQVLDLSNNHIEILPVAIGNLTKLKKFDLGSNRLKTVPKEIGNLINLDNLLLFSNKLEEIPKEIGIWKILEAYI